GREYEGSAAVERIRLGHQLDRGAGVGGEADGVVVAGVEGREPQAARGMDRARAGLRAGMLRMRIAEDRLREQAAVRGDLRVGVEAAARVVEVGERAGVEPRELAEAEI